MLLEQQNLNADAQKLFVSKWTICQWWKNNSKNQAQWDSNWETF